MAFDRKSEPWIPPCDLCGSFRHETVALGGGTTIRRCYDCGLVSIAQNDERPPAGLPVRARVPLEILTGALEQSAGDRPQSVLVIGPPPAEFLLAAEQAGTDLTVLVEPGYGEIAGATTFQGSFESATFVPDKFDLILCVQGLESFASPALLFERARYWLTPGGTLLVGALNLSSLPARLKRQNWLLRYARSARHLLSLETMKRYAKRYGFDIKSIRTRSRTEEVASIITGRERAAWLSEMALAPLALAASLLGMGVMVIVEMTKGGLVARPIRRELEEELEGTPGLAPALYTSVRRERVAECG